jgi:short-subunit dehydrogenase
VNLQNRVVLVTGASSGIGEATARHLARLGVRVILVARTKETLDKIVQEIQSAGGKACAMPCDLGDVNAVSKLAEDVQRDVGVPDALVLSAGAGRWLWLEETEPDEAQAMLASPFWAAFWVARAFMPGMLERCAGRVVIVGSPVAWLTWPGATAYTVSRFALRGLFESLRVDLVGTGVTVSMVVPGQVSSAYFTNNPGVLERAPRIATRLIPPVSVEQVAQVIETTIRTGRAVTVLPWLVRVFFMVNVIAPGLVRWLLVSSGYRHQAANRKS